MKNDLQNSLEENKNELENVEKAEEVTEEIGTLEVKDTEKVDDDTSVSEVVEEEATKNEKVMSNAGKEKNNNVKKSFMDQLKNKKGVLIIGSVIVVVVLVVLGLYFLVFNNPSKVYKKIISQSINKLSSFVIRQGNSDKMNFTVSTDVDLDLGLSMLGKDVLDLVNESKIKLNYQFDKANKKLFFNLKFDNSDEQILNSELLIDGNLKKIYGYESSIYDKYLMADLSNNSFYTSLFNIFDEYPSFNNGSADFEKMQNIIVEELSKIIKLDDCYNEDGYFVFEVTVSELMERMEKVFKDLSKNKEFLDNFEDSTYVKNVLSEFAYDTDGYMLDSTIKFSTSLNGNEVEEMIVSIDNNEFVIEFTENMVSYDLKISNQSIFSGYVKNVEEGNTKKVEIVFNSLMLGKIQVNVDIIDNGNPVINEIDSSNVKLVDELSDEELDQLLEKFEESNLYGLFEEMTDGMYSDFETNFENGFDIDSFNDLFNDSFGDTFNDSFGDTFNDSFGDLDMDLGDFEFNFGF